MSGFSLTLKAAVPLRLDLRGITPVALAALSADKVERLTVGHGNALLPLGEFFRVTARSDDTLLLQGELSRCDHVGWQMDGGVLVAEGSVGDCAGGGMTSGTLSVKGDAGALAACEMAGGTLSIEGSVGDFAASTLPGSMDGMRGGTLIVRGNAGARFGDRMRRGTALIFGDAGDFLASRMVAGTIALAGRAGAHVGYGMRRGSVVLAGPAPAPSSSFVPAVAGAPVFWQLLTRDLAPHGGVFASLSARGIVRHLGDIAAGGKGELIVVR
ncbi:formylmethanofuran dehydrogenase subunit C [uncultured Piscinibacter sp.]|uniref:formylmethanofuran dehydrogenase subunit C n=1 Tax=uncultured Piscinibacter sp. TaxID=1131835 RepID=UPI002619BBF2|nr:formylmethanofuran dehydrogenase subunit C [uncultured Piscinibacter sp.]